MEVKDSDSHRSLSHILRFLFQNYCVPIRYFPFVLSPHVPQGLSNEIHECASSDYAGVYHSFTLDPDGYPNILFPSRANNPR
jgi:hypothetical protein